MRLVPHLVVAVFVAACGSSPSEPSAPPTAPAGPTPTLTPPAPDNPDPDEQLTTLRPAFRVTNGTSDQAGTRTYEFDVSDNSGFTPTLFSKTGVPEGAGATSFTLEEDLQPTTRFYWRARMRQGSTASAWSPTETFKTKLVGFVRAGELYDPLIHGETVGVRLGPTSFVPDKGIRLETLDSRVMYQLPQSLSEGEFSLRATGLDNDSGGETTKLFSMQQGSSDITTNPYRATVEKRANGTVSFRLIAGDGDSRADADRRIVQFNSSATYFWKFTWGNGTARLVITVDDERGPVLFDNAKGYGGTYLPNPHIAHLGAPPGRSGLVDASVPGAIIKDVWISNRPRPTSLGSALRPAR